MGNMLRIWLMAMVLASVLPAVTSGQVALREVVTPGGPASLESVQAYVLHSKILEEDRQVDVILPPSHRVTDRMYPLVLVFDGEAILGSVSASAKALSDVGHMPEAVVVGVRNTDRLRDLSPPGVAVSGNDGSGRADRFVQFLLDELIPTLASKFRAGSPITLVGHSSGGLFVHFAALSEPDVFDSILSLDAPMHLGRSTLARVMVEVAAESSTAFRLVTLETRFGWSDGDWEALAASASPLWELHRADVDGESHGSMVWPASYAGLKTLFGWYSAVGVGQGSPIDRLAAFDGLAEASAAVPPASSLIRQVIEDRIGRLELEEATAALERLIAAYGETGLSERLRAEIDSTRDEELVGPTLERLLSSPRASGEEVGALIGEWSGYTESAGGPRSSLRLSLRLEGDGVRGEFRFEQGNEHVLEYIVRSGNEYHLGYMNRMRPRGMLMYEGKVEDGVFSGEFVLRGVVFRFPDGREIPRTVFHLVRAG